MLACSHASLLDGLLARLLACLIPCLLARLLACLGHLSQATLRHIGPPHELHWTTLGTLLLPWCLQSSYFWPRLGYLSKASLGNFGHLSQATCFCTTLRYLGPPQSSHLRQPWATLDHLSIPPYATLGYLNRTAACNLTTREPRQSWSLQFAVTMFRRPIMHFALMVIFSMSPARSQRSAARKRLCLAVAFPLRRWISCSLFCFRP